jgi:hypothetical protein
MHPDFNGDPLLRVSPDRPPLKHLAAAYVSLPTDREGRRVEEIMQRMERFCSQTPGVAVIALILQHICSRVELLNAGTKPCAFDCTLT